MIKGHMQSSPDTLVRYFGYGANRCKECLEKILGTEIEEGKGAILHDYALCYQTLEQIPNPPQELLQKIWGNTFRCYTIYPFPKGIVAGVVWSLTRSQLNQMKEWEFEGIWKKIVEIPVTLFTGETLPAWTDLIPQTLSIHEAVDGLYYQNNLNPQGKILGVEDEFRIQAMMKAREELQTYAFLSTKN